VNSEQRGERRRERAWWLGILLGVIVGTVFTCSFPCLEPFYASAFPDLCSQRNPTVSRFNPPPQPFDQAKWQRGYATDRIAMAKWLASSGTLLGMKRDQVTAMLGPQDSEFDYEGVTRVKWGLGRIDDNSLFDRKGRLTLDFDGAGKVVKAEVWFDD
jgi:hypothetical protein